VFADDEDDEGDDDDDVSKLYRPTCLFVDARGGVLVYLADARERVLDLHHLTDVLGFEVVLVEVLGHAVDLV
jgi:hypothetical protein